MVAQPSPVPRRDQWVWGELPRLWRFSTCTVIRRTAVATGSFWTVKMTSHRWQMPMTKRVSRIVRTPSDSHKGQMMRGIMERDGATVVPGHATAGILKGASIR
jgi:hypothetical protein